MGWWWRMRLAVAADVDDVTVMDEPINERGGHHLVAEDLPPLGETLIRRQYRARVLVPFRHELKEEHGAGSGDGQIADLVDDEQRGKDKRLHPLLQVAGLLGVFERRDQVGERPVVEASATLRRGDGETDREMGLPNARWPEEDDILLPLDEAERVQAVDLLV